MVPGLSLTSTAGADLIGWWKLDEGAGTTFADSSAYGHNGTIADPCADRVRWTTDGYRGRALEFLTSFAPFTFVDANLTEGLLDINEATYAFWMNMPEAHQPWGPIFVLLGEVYDYDVEPDTEGQLWVYGQGGCWWGGAVPTVNDGWWHHVAVTFSGPNNIAVLYVDGEEIANTSAGYGGGSGWPFSDPISAVRIGGPRDRNRWANFTGRIDEVAVFNEALSAAEVADLFKFGIQTLSQASKPSPANRETDVNLPVTLTWYPGINVQDVNGHEVYLGTSFDEVNDANTASVGIYQGALDKDTNSFTPSPGLEYGRTYYWRIDEVNEPNTWKGRVWSFTVYSGTARGPEPADNASNVRPDAVLSWSPGYYAASHEVYFSTDFNDVNDRDPCVLTVEADPCHNPGLLELATTYYWAVDEVNLTLEPNRQPGDVWCFTVYPGTAWGPEPADNVSNVRPDAVLSWSPGYYAVSHDVYFGTSFADVNDANNSLPVGSSVYKGQQVYDSNSYDPCGLEFGTTYYWRIDEVNEPNIWRGEVWKFTVTEYIVVGYHCGPEADFNGDGKVNFLDYAGLADAWLSEFGQDDFNDTYDLYDDDRIDAADLGIFTEDWLWQYEWLSREKINFNGGWRFFRGDISGDAAKDYSYDDYSWQPVHLPHAPVISPLHVEWPWPGNEGISWYRKHFTIGDCYQGKKIFIEFEGADQVADVWINGVYLTTHYGSHLPFTVDITDYVSFGTTENVIAVKADDKEDSDIPAYDLWISSGGLYRDVEMHITDKLHVTNAVDANIVAGGGIFVTYPSVNDVQAQVQVKTHVKNEYATSKNCTVKTYIVDANNITVAQMTGDYSITAAGNYTFTQSATVTSPRLWHPNHPYLYTVHTEVYDNNSPVDTYQTKIGIRSISFSKAEGFKINGQALRFRGTNRVHDYPYLGWAMGNIGQRRDAEKLKEAGFEFVRTSHCPPDPAFMEACDELGIMIMDEIPGFQFFGNSTFQNRSYQNMRDMIRRDRNHPCVIAWELSLNETWWEGGEWDNYSSTAVSIGHAEYPGNQRYIAGWKDDTTYDIFIATPTAGARTYSGTRPLIIDEYGHWEYGGNSSTSDVDRSDGEAAMLQQIANHQDGHNLNRGMSNMCGDSLWVGIDFGAWPSGVYDFLRLPKFSAYFFQSQRDPNLDLSYLGIDSGPMVHIANYWTASSPTTVKVFSNCGQVKLYKNSVLQATQYPDTGTNLQHPPFTFTGLTFTSGELKAEGLIGDEVVATHIVRTPGSATALSVAFDVNNVPANGSETIAVNASILDSNGTLVPTASSTNVTFTVTGPATLASPATITSEAGIATAYIRVTDQPGLITVTATASGLTSDDASITSE